MAYTAWKFICQNNTTEQFNNHYITKYPDGC